MLQRKCESTRFGGLHDPRNRHSAGLPQTCRSPTLYRRLRCPDHHGQRRTRLGPALAREARRGGSAGLFGKSDRPARAGHGALKPVLVRANDRASLKGGPDLGPGLRWMAATLDGTIEGTGAVFEAKFMLPWSFSEESAAEKHMPQLQHNMWVTNAT